MARYRKEKTGGLTEKELIDINKKDQLPALKNHRTGQVTAAVEFTENQLADIASGKKIYFTFLTYNQPLQPIGIYTDPEHLEEAVKANDEWIEETIIKPSNEKKKRIKEGKIYIVNCPHCKEQLATIPDPAGYLMLDETCHIFECPKCKEEVNVATELEKQLEAE